MNCISKIAIKSMLCKLKNKFTISNTHKRNILIVEDNAANQAVLKDIVADEYEYFLADSGQAGLVLLREHYKEISLVLLDFAMPLMDGYEFLKNVKAEHLLANIPVIMTIGQEASEAELKCLDMGVVDFIKKPYNTAIIRARCRNIIRLAEQESILGELEYDVTTGIYNREAFLMHAERLLHNYPDSRIDLMAFDIDNYRQINEIYGFETANEVLRYTAQCLTSEASNIDLVGHYDNDRFVALMVNLDNKEYDRATIKRLYKKQMLEAPVNKININICEYLDMDRSVPLYDTYERMFEEIYKHNSTYGICWIDFGQKEKERFDTEREMERCMTESLKNGDFKVILQPKHDVATGHLVGAEALVRWIHPKYGFMNPGIFIPLFEQNGFVSYVDAYVVKVVCKLQKKWSEAGMPAVPISINVSRRDFFNAHYNRHCERYLQQSEVNPALIHFEVTESLYTEDIDTINDILARMQAAGYSIELDDFGTGYSALSLLSEMPMDIVKLDMSFVRKLDKMGIVVKSIIEMMHAIKKKVIAEGVETDEQYRILRSFGCDIIQGYYFSKPLSVEDFEVYMQGDGSASGEAKVRNAIAI